MMNTKNSNMGDEILIRQWQRERMGIADATGKRKGIKPGG